jgi:hypothetical protein
MGRVTARGYSRVAASGYHGVYPSGNTDVDKLWRAIVEISGYKYTIGLYPTALEAARGFDRELIRRYGERAKHRLNFPMEDYTSERPA